MDRLWYWNTAGVFKAWLFEASPQIYWWQHPGVVTLEGDVHLNLNCGSWALRILKYLLCCLELCEPLLGLDVDTTTKCGPNYLFLSCFYTICTHLCLSPHPEYIASNSSRSPSLIFKLSPGLQEVSAANLVTFCIYWQYIFYNIFGSRQPLSALPGQNQCVYWYDDLKQGGDFTSEPFFIRLKKERVTPLSRRRSVITA